MPAEYDPWSSRHNKHQQRNRFKFEGSKTNQPFSEYFFPEKGWNFGSSFFGGCSCLGSFAGSCSILLKARRLRCIIINLTKSNCSHLCCKPDHPCGTQSGSKSSDLCKEICTHSFIEMWKTHNDEKTVPFGDPWCGLRLSQTQASPESDECYLVNWTPQKTARHH